MEVDAVGLLRTHSVVEVRDLDLEISGDAARLYDKFADELRERYQGILDVTESIGGLFGCLRKGEHELRDLCFKDDVYKLKKLEGIDGKTNGGNVEATKDLETDDDSYARKVLLISNWSLAVSDFVSRFAVSASSAKLFEKVIIEFQKLEEWQEYEEVVSSKCEEFVQYLLDCPMNNISFTVEQWARIWSLVLNGSKFPWNEEQQTKLRGILFHSIFQEPLETLMNDTDEAVVTLVHSSEFGQKLNAKILRDIELQFQLLEDLANQQEEDQTPTFSYPQAVQELDVARVVENCKLHSLGLTTRTRIRMYNLVNPLIQLIDDLEAHGGKPDQVAELRKKLSGVLKAKIPVITEQPEEPSSEPLTMDRVVEQLITNQNDLSAFQLIDKQISALKA